MRLSLSIRRNLVKSKRIIANSIKDQLISHVSSLKTPIEVFDVLKNMFEGVMQTLNNVGVEGFPKVTVCIQDVDECCNIE